MNRESFEIMLGELDPAKSLSDASISELIPLSNLENTITRKLSQPNNGVTITARPHSRRRVLIATSAASSVVAIATVITLASLPATQIAALHGSKPPTGRTIFGQSTGTVNPQDRQFASVNFGPLTPVQPPACRSSQISTSLTDVSSAESPQFGWTGTFWFRNTGGVCEMSRTNIELQAVTGTQRTVVGSMSVNDDVARSPFRLTPGQVAFANASVSPIDVPAPGHQSGTIADFCSARNVTGFVLIGYQYHWPNQYFPISRSVSVCTHWFLNVSGAVLAPIARR